MPDQAPEKPIRADPVWGYVDFWHTFNNLCMNLEVCLSARDTAQTCFWAIHAKYLRQKATEEQRDTARTHWTEMETQVKAARDALGTFVARVAGHPEYLLSLQDYRAHLAEKENASA